jgi:hypothetical protein
MVALVVLSLPVRADDMVMEVSLNFGTSGMNSFASYRYTDDLIGGSPQRYEQYHVIVNGNAQESTDMFTDFWSNNLTSHVVPEPPTCYNARITLLPFTPEPSPAAPARFRTTARLALSASRALQGRRRAMRRRSSSARTTAL